MRAKQRRSFSSEFKREAAALVLDQGSRPVEACRAVGVVESAASLGAAAR